MYTALETEQFSTWLSGLSDNMTRLRLIKRIRKASLGNLGDTKSVGDSIFEMREFFGPGWRMYYTEKNGSIIFMLGGGDKSSQTVDIANAKLLAKEI